VTPTKLVKRMVDMFAVELIFWKVRLGWEWQAEIRESVKA